MITDIIIGITYISTVILGSLIIWDLMAALSPKFRELLSDDDEQELK